MEDSTSGMKSEESTSSGKEQLNSSMNYRYACLSCNKMFLAWSPCKKCMKKCGFQMNGVKKSEIMNRCKEKATQQGACYQKLTDRGNMPTEDELVREIRKYYDSIKGRDLKKHVLDHLRRIYGPGNFGLFGFGTFPEFAKKHNLDWWNETSVESKGQKKNDAMNNHCSMCSKSFSTKAGLKSHLQMKHSSETKLAEPPKMTSASNQKSTQETPSEEAGQGETKKTQERKKSMENLQRKKPRLIQCLKCSKKFSSNNALESHYGHKHSKNNHCSLCSKSFSTKGGLKSHLQMQHSSDTKLSEPPKMASNQTQKTPSEEAEQIETTRERKEPMKNLKKNKPRLIQCLKCSKKFSSNTALESHYVQKHSTKQSKPYPQQAGQNGKNVPAEKQMAQKTKRDLKQEQNKEQFKRSLCSKSNKTRERHFKEKQLYSIFFKDEKYVRPPKSTSTPKFQYSESALIHDYIIVEGSEVKHFKSKREFHEYRDLDCADSPWTVPNTPVLSLHAKNRMKERGISTINTKNKDVEYVLNSSNRAVVTAYKKKQILGSYHFENLKRMSIFFGNRGSLLHHITNQTNTNLIYNKEKLLIQVAGRPSLNPSSALHMIKKYDRQTKIFTPNNRLAFCFMIESDALDKMQTDTETSIFYFETSSVPSSFPFKCEVGDIRLRITKIPPLECVVGGIKKKDIKRAIQSINDFHVVTQSFQPQRTQSIDVIKERTETIEDTTSTLCWYEELQNYFVIVGECKSAVDCAFKIMKDLDEKIAAHS